MKQFARMSVTCLLASLVLFTPVVIFAGGGGGTDVKMADEYYEMEKGNWPKEVTFSDTAFTNQVHTSTASVLYELNSASTEAHTFTVKAGDRVSFALKGSHYGSINYTSESLVFWTLKNSSYRCAAVNVAGDGLYLIKKDMNSYDMKVSDFGFDNDLSDLKAHVSISMTFPAVRVMEEKDIPLVPGEAFAHDFPDLFKQDLKFRDTVTVTAEGNAHVSPVDRANTTVYLTDTYDMTLKESDSMGFQFILDENAKWNCSLNGTSFAADRVSYDYSIVWEDYPASLNETQIYNSDTMVYRTLSIVLVDSDLKTREATVVDKWLAEEKEWEENKNQNSNQPSGSKTAPLISRKAKAIPALVGLTLISIIAAAALSAVSSSPASARKEEEKEEKKQEKEEIILNEQEDIPAILAGSRSVLSVPAVLDSEKEGLWIWSAYVFTDEKQTETLPSVMAAVTGTDKNARLELKAQDTGYDYGAVVRVNTRCPEIDTFVTASVPVKILSPGLHALRNEDGITVTFRTQGEIPGTAEIRTLEAGEYDTDGRGTYSYQGYAAKEREAA